MTEPAFKFGCRGHMIGVLQRALNIPDDNKFGRQTRNAIMDLQHRKMMKETGEAGPSVFKALGLRWPSPFDICLQVVDQFEGTGFGGMNGTDIDGWGVTLGIIGFTSKNGEVQKLVREYIYKRPSALNALPAGKSAELKHLVENADSTHQQWRDFFYINGRAHPGVRAALAYWGKDFLFQEIQMVRAYEKYWKPAEAQAAKLGFRSLQGAGLMFDTWVQNGGWRTEHQTRFLGESQDGTEGSKLRAAARAVASMSAKRWQDVVLRRKMVYAMGFGEVNGETFDLMNYAFPPLEARS